MALQFNSRPETTDVKVIAEVIKRNVYERKKMNFFIKDSPKWLDLGGNIGTFTCLAASKGCSVVTFEPEPDNFKLLTENVELNKSNNVTLYQEGVVVGDSGTLDLYVCKGDYNKYRHTICKKRGRATIPIKVRNFKSVLNEYRPTGVKIDIEGAEIEILESMKTWPDFVTHIVFEYSFDIDKSIPRFKKIIDSLSKQYEVFHSKFDETKPTWEFFPQAILVYCLKKMS
jgi:FkbM family methyltransferase